MAPDSPAAAAGFVAGDAIVQVGDEPVDSIDEAIALVDAQAGKETSIILAVGEEQRTVTVTPRVDVPEGEGSLGIGLVRTGTVFVPMV